MLTLNSQIGIGGFGIVYSATLQGKGLVAVKVLSLLREDRGRLRKVLPNLFECVILSTFRHPFLSTALQITSSENKLFIIQELAKMDLHQWRQSSIPTEDLLRSWATSLSSAILLLHRYSILHGDIKPSNILLYPDDQVRSADFTLSRYLEGGLGSRLTPCTPNYRPLEVYLQRPISLEIDLWAFGCTLFEITYNYSLFPLQTSPGAYINCLLRWLNEEKISYRPVDYQLYKLPDTWKKREIDLLISNLLKEEGSRSLPPAAIGKYSICKSSKSVEEEISRIESKKEVYNCLLSHLSMQQEEPCSYFEEELKICQHVGFRLINFTRPTKATQPDRMSHLISATTSSPLNPIEKET